MHLHPERPTSLVGDSNISELVLLCDYVGWGVGVKMSPVGVMVEFGMSSSIESNFACKGQKYVFMGVP